MLLYMPLFACLSLCTIHLPLNLVPKWQSQKYRATQFSYRFMVHIVTGFIFVLLAFRNEFHTMLVFDYLLLLVGIYIYQPI